jgi:hypothetical protein
MRSRYAMAGLMAIVFLVAAGACAQQATSTVHGYVKVDGAYTNGVNVTLSNEASGSTVTADKDGHAGYYEFTVNDGSRIIITARSGSFSGYYSYFVNAPDVSVPDIDISTATPTPSPTPSPTPVATIRRPSMEPGGKVVHGDSSSFIPASARNPSVTPAPKPTVMSSVAPTVPTATPEPSARIISNAYIWPAIILLAILVIAAAIILKR